MRGRRLTVRFPADFLLLAVLLPLLLEPLPCVPVLPLVSFLGQFRRIWPWRPHKKQRPSDCRFFRSTSLKPFPRSRQFRRSGPSPTVAASTSIASKSLRDCWRVGLPNVAASVLAHAEEVAASWSEADHYHPSSFNFSTRGRLAFIEGLRDWISLKNGAR